jgi:Fe-S oxidoreductase
LKIAAPFGGIWNAIFKVRSRGGLIKRMIGFSPQRSMPHISPASERKSFAKSRERSISSDARNVYLFGDEFTRTLDAGIGNKAIELLQRLGYNPVCLPHAESGRSAFSKGMLRRAKRMADANVRQFGSLVSDDEPLVGIEPSAILGFRDEYPDIVDACLKDAADALAPNCLTIEEFLCREMDAGRIKESAFTDRAARMLVHGHCHGKALAGMDPLIRVMNFPRHYDAVAIPSGCCGMAGSFGYEKEHYALSQQVGELVLFPAVRDADAETIIVAPGTSCRHQIVDGTGRRALHPVEVLVAALI